MDEPRNSAEAIMMSAALFIDVTSSVDFAAVAIVDLLPSEKQGDRSFGQGLHPSEELAYMPNGQGSQNEENGFDATVPARQGLHEGAPAAEKVPAGHTAHCADPELFEYAPAGQGKHTPAFREQFPTQPASVVLEYHPGGHG